ncbi:MAG: hypothetical protein WCT04_03310 [Planctomycetota bacterium]
MIKGVSKPGEIAHLGLGNRLLARIGALLKKKLSITVAVLESAKAGSPIETLLLSGGVLQDAATLTSEDLNALATEAGVATRLAISDADGERVLCLEDEVESGDEWSGAIAQPLATQQPSTVATRPNVEASGNAPNELFGGDHLTRVRLKLMTSADAKERIEALRILAFSPLIASEKAEAVLQGLADADETVRAEAAALLPGLGVGPDIAAALADLNKGDSAQRIAAAEKLARISTTPSHELADGAVIVCAISSLKSGVERVLKLRLLDLLLTRADIVGRNAVRLSDLIRVLVGLIAAANKIGPSSRELDELNGLASRLVKELGKRHAESLLPIIKTERERAPDAAVEAFLLGSLFDLIAPEHVDNDQLMDWSAAYLARDVEEGRASRAIGALMSKRGGVAVEKLCAVFTDATPGSQKHFLLLLDELCRRSDVIPSSFASASNVIVAAMESGSKALRMAAMECRLVCDPRVPAQTRRLLAELFLDSTRDFAFSFDIEKAESAVERMGVPAVEPLLAHLGKDRAPNERIRAARLLGELARIVKPEPVDVTTVSNPSETRFARVENALTQALRKLESASLDTDFPDRGEVFCALGKIIACPAASIEANAIVARTLLDAAAGSDPKLAPRALEGAAYMASSRRAQPDFIAATVKLLKAAINDPEPQHSETTSQNSSGETVFEIEGGERYAVNLPIALSGLERVALGQNCPALTTREIGTLLLDRWKELCNGLRIWGPANASALNDALRAIAMSPVCGPDLRMEIIKGLLVRLTRTPTMHSLADILAADDTRASSGAALCVGYAILGRHDAEGRFPEPDRSDILLALARIASRKSLLAPASEIERTSEAFRRTVVNELIKGTKDSIPGAAQALDDLSKNDALPSDLRAEIERRVKVRKEMVRR